jgi:hypothetical protein
MFFFEKKSASDNTQRENMAQPQEDVLEEVEEKKDKKKKGCDVHLRLIGFFCDLILIRCLHTCTAARFTAVGSFGTLPASRLKSRLLHFSKTP